MTDSTLQIILQNEFNSWMEYRQDDFIAQFRNLHNLQKLYEIDKIDILLEALQNYFPAYGDKNIRDDDGNYNDRWAELDYAAVSDMSFFEYKRLLLEK